MKVLALSLWLVAACDDSGSHVFAARLYEPTRLCVDPTTSVDVVNGNDPGSSCEPTCLTPHAAPDGGAPEIYVSRMCPPYPPLYDTAGGVAGCDGAIAATVRGDTCLADGGSSHPVLAEAGVDAASDAGR